MLKLMFSIREMHSFSSEDEFYFALREETLLEVRFPLVLSDIIVV
jgi:hypothetical protein